MIEREEKALEMFQDFMELVEQHPEMMEKFKKHLEPKND